MVAWLNGARYMCFTRGNDSALTLWKVGINFKPGRDGVFSEAWADARHLLSAGLWICLRVELVCQLRLSFWAASRASHQRCTIAQNVDPARALTCIVGACACASVSGRSRAWAQVCQLPCETR